MFNIIKLLFDICLFKKGPQDVPYSVGLLWILLGFYVVIRALMLNIRFDMLTVLLQVVVEVLLVAGFSWMLLALVAKRHRLCQVTAAFLGTDALISFVVLPAIATMALGQGGLLVFLVMLVLIGWHWAVTGHIIHNALEQNLSFSLGLAFLYLLGSYQVMALLFPEVAGVN